jgi:acyl-CoA hydrolase
VVDRPTVGIVGLGNMGAAVATRLAEGDGGDYGIHSEMFTTGLMRLHQAGKVTNARKGIYEGFTITTFAAGVAELYEWLDGEESVRFLPVEVVNSPEIIARNNRMVMVNGAVSIDLAGQVVADTVQMRQYSGIGGHEDFTMPSGLELEDRSLICLSSTVSPGGGPAQSRLVAAHPAGTIITTPRHQLDVVITEHGIAELRGKTVRERALALAEIAHPDFRGDLLAAADELS